MFEEYYTAVESTLHCQRNWDLSKTIPTEHMQLFEYIVKTAPSKQSLAFYRVHFITNRTIQENIYNSTQTQKHLDYYGIVSAWPDFYNPQVLANLLVVFEEYFDADINNVDRRPKYLAQNLLTDVQKRRLLETFDKDRRDAIGIAAGQLSLAAALLGYKTGFCKCFDFQEVKSIVNAQNSIRMLLGIGFPNEGIPHTQHHLHPEYPKRAQPKTNIPVNYVY